MYTTRTVEMDSLESKAVRMRYHVLITTAAFRVERPQMQMSMYMPPCQPCCCRAHAAGDPGQLAIAVRTAAGNIQPAEGRDRPCPQARLQ